MSQTIGIRELKNQASGILRQVREEAAAYVITHHGHPVAILRPIEEADLTALKKQEAHKSWQALQLLGLKLAQSEPEKMSARSHLEVMREEIDQ